MFLTFFFVLAVALIACPVGFGEDGIAIFNAAERDNNTVTSPTIITGTAAAEIPLLNCGDSDVVILDAYALISKVGGGTGADGAFKIGHTDGAASPTTDDDSIAGSTTISKTTATAPLSSKVACTLLTTMAPTALSANDLKFPGKPIIPAGKTIIVTTVQGASGVAEYRVVVHYRRIGKTS